MNVDISPYSSDKGAVDFATELQRSPRPDARVADYLLTESVIAVPSRFESVTKDAS